MKTWTSKTWTWNTAVVLAMAVLGSPARAEGVFPSLAPLEGISHQEIVDTVLKRRAQFATLAAQEAKADAAIKAALGDFSVLRSADERQKVAAAAVEALKLRAQLELERQAYAGLSKDIPTAAGAPTLAPHSTEQLVESPTWHAMLLGLLGDKASQDILVGYWGLSREVIGAIEAFVTADAAGQMLQVKQLNELVGSAPESTTVSGVGAAMLKWNLAATPEVKDAMVGVLRRSTSPLALMYINRITSAQNIAAMQKTIGQPLTVAGQLVDGSMFSTESLKGKVVLIDFWATWCGPCVKEMPKVQALYEQYKDQGFEIVGVMNDYSKEAVVKYLGQNPGVSWPQFYDPTAAVMREMNPIARKFGVTLLPTMYILDRNGVLRSVTARKELETIIPQLLAEPVK
jgi:thiol-disulfide isomerase/thioredoxin